VLLSVLQGYRERKNIYSRILTKIVAHTYTLVLLNGLGPIVTSKSEALVVGKVTYHHTL